MLGAIKEESVTNCLFVNVVLNKIMTAFDCYHFLQRLGLLCSLNASKDLSIDMENQYSFSYWKCIFFLNPLGHLLSVIFLVNNFKVFFFI